MRDFDDGVNALMRLTGSLFQDISYSKLHDDCREAFDKARMELYKKYEAEEKEADKA